MATRAQRGRLRLVEAPEESRGPASRDGAPGPSAAARDDGLEEGVAVDVAPSSHAQATRTPLPLVEARAPLGSEPALPAPTPVSPASTRAQLQALSDAQLVSLGCAGEVAALEMLYRRHAAFAIHLAARIEGSSRDVEDIAHDAFVRAFERLHDLTDRAAFRSWLGAIVVHAVRSRMRRQRLMSLLGLGKSSEPVDLDALASSDASPHVRAQIAQIYALLRTLATDDRIAWTLRCVEGHDLETVARMTRCSLATVKRRITRAQRFLEEHFVEPQADAPAAEAPPLHDGAASGPKPPAPLSSDPDLTKEVPR